MLSNFEQFTQPYAVANKIASIYLTENLKSPAAVRFAPQLLSDYVGRYALYDLTLKIGSVCNRVYGNARRLSTASGSERGESVKHARYRSRY